MGLHPSSVRHYGLNGDANSVLLVADIVLYGSSQDEQGFPPVLIRAMTFGIPVIAPDIPTMKKHVSIFTCFCGLDSFFGRLWGVTYLCFFFFFLSFEEIDK